MFTTKELFLACLNGVVPLILLMIVGVIVAVTKVYPAEKFGILSGLIFKATFPLSMVYFIGIIVIDKSDILIIVCYFLTVCLFFFICLITSFFLDTMENIPASIGHMWVTTTMANSVGVGRPMLLALFTPDVANKYSFLQIIGWGPGIAFYYFCFELWRTRKQAIEEAETPLSSPESTMFTSSHIELKDVKQNGMLETSHLQVEQGQNEESNGPMLELRQVTPENEITGTPARRRSMKSMTIITDKNASKVVSKPTLPSIQLKRSAKKKAARKQVVKVHYGLIIGRALLNTIKIPMVIAFILGIIYNLIATYLWGTLRALPEMIQVFFDYCNMLTAPGLALMMGLFTVFITQNEIKLKKEHKSMNKHEWGMEVLRFILMTVLGQLIKPLIFLGLMIAFHIPPEIILPNVLCSSVPPAVFAYPLAVEYKYHPISPALTVDFNLLTLMIFIPILYYICVHVLHLP